MSMAVSAIVPSESLVPSHLLRGGRLTARSLHHPLYLLEQGHALLHT